MILSCRFLFILSFLLILSLLYFVSHVLLYCMHKIHICMASKHISMCLHICVHVRISPCVCMCVCIDTIENNSRHLLYAYANTKRFRKWPNDHVNAYLNKILFACAAYIRLGMWLNSCVCMRRHACACLRWCRWIFAFKQHYYEIQTILCLNTRRLSVTVI